MAALQKKQGRPAKPAAERGETFSVRILPAIRAQLESAASAANRSLCAEIMHRLQRTLDTNSDGPTKAVTSPAAPTELDRYQRAYLETILFQIEAITQALLNEIGCDAEKTQSQLLALSIQTICHGGLIEVGAR